MRVQTLKRLLNGHGVDNQAEVILEDNKGRRFHARDVKIVNPTTASTNAPKKVVISSVE